MVLCERARADGGEVLAFDAEPLCWRRFTGVGGATAWLKPDAFVRFGAGEYEHLSFVEVDRATASVPTVARKLGVYRRYWQTGRDQERFGAFGRVLLLAPHEARRDDSDRRREAPADRRAALVSGRAVRGRGRPLDREGVVKTLPRNTILTGDARDVLAGLLPESVDCCVTSPPYANAIRDYGARGQLGREPTVTEYVENLRTVLRRSPAGR